MTNGNKISLFVDTVKSMFPELDMTTLRFGNSKTKKWHHYDFNIPNENKHLINSPYFYEKRSVAHFTSFHALSSILQEKSIRLYNLHALNDPREFTFASRIFRLDRNLIDDAKDNLHLMSFCGREILNRPADEFNMWRLYGHQGRGIAIVFKIINDPKKWTDFHFSEVSYGDKNRSNLKNLVLLMDELKNAGHSMSADFGKLCAFHKSNLFKHEVEVRLIFDHRKNRVEGSRTVKNKDKLIFPIIKSDLLKMIDNKDKVRYLKIPLFHTDLDSKPNDTPLLKIEQIIIGYNYGDEVKRIISEVKDLCQENIGYLPIIKQTRLRKYYWDIENS